MFKYGMKLRPFSIGCQPMEGLMKVEEDSTGKYWNILYYADPLNDHEQDGYELDYLGERTEQNYENYMHGKRKRMDQKIDAMLWSS